MDSIEYASLDEAETALKAFAQANGFEMAVNQRHPPRSQGEASKRVNYRCVNHGAAADSPQTTKCDYRVNLKKISDQSSWEISVVKKKKGTETVHNHPLVQSSFASRLFNLASMLSPATVLFYLFALVVLVFSLRWVLFWQSPQVLQAPIDETVVRKICDVHYTLQNCRSITPVTFHSVLGLDPSRAPFSPASESDAPGKPQYAAVQRAVHEAYHRRTGSALPPTEERVHRDAQHATADDCDALPARVATCLLNDTTRAQYADTFLPILQTHGDDPDAGSPRTWLLKGWRRVSTLLVGQSEMHVVDKRLMGLHSICRQVGVRFEQPA